MKKKPVVIVSVTNDLYTDQRVHKVCSFLLQQGYRVRLVGRVKKNSVDLETRAYETHRMKLLFEKGPFFYAAFNFRLFLYLLFRRADILLSNDLDTLLANYAAHRFKPNSKLVYDTHEYFTEVPELLNRKRIRSIWLGIEAWIFPKLKSVYTVNRSIADIYTEKYKVDVKVVRNISEKWISKEVPSKKALGIPEEKNLLILQGAGINIHRGAEEAVEAMNELDAVLLIVGDGDVVPQLKQRVKELNIEEKVIFFGRLPYKQMMFYTSHADIGLSLDQPTNANYQLSLPNKLFDYMHAETPILATSIPAVKAFIEEHQIGVVMNEFSVQNLVESVQDMLSNTEQLDVYRSNCKKVSALECWENECTILEEIYPKVEV